MSMRAPLQVQREAAPTASVTPVRNGLVHHSPVTEGAAGAVLPGVHEVLHARGEPLDATTRAFMEPRFGHDFSDVRVHTDSSAAESADAVNAVAFTAGRHIVFGRGQYAPQTPRGRHVLAHELTHTLQQAESSGSLGIQRIPKDPQGVPFEGEIIPWSAALHESPSLGGTVLADLPRGHPVSVRGGRAWILVETLVEGKKLTGYVSHELIRQVSKTPAEPAEKAADETARTVADPTKPPADEAPTSDADRLPPVTVSPKLTQLKELLEQSDVPEDRVINLMRIMTMGEIYAVAKSTDYRDKAVAALDDAEMMQALDAMRLTGALRHDWMTAEGIAVYAVEAQSEFMWDLEGVSLNPELVSRVRKLCQDVIDNNLATGNLSLSEGMRSPSTAHKWSTAYYIQQGTIPQARLEALPGGMDQDGNVWWKKGWSQSDAVANAKSIWSRAMAYEGYAPGDPRRLPNTDDVERSQHCFGEAMDVKIPWRNGDGWHQEARALVENAGLSRPVAGEHWHFELKR